MVSTVLVFGVFVNGIGILHIEYILCCCCSAVIIAIAIAFAITVLFVIIILLHYAKTKQSFQL